MLDEVIFKPHSKWLQTTKVKLHFLVFILSLLLEFSCITISLLWFLFSHFIRHCYHTDMPMLDVIFKFLIPRGIFSLHSQVHFFYCKWPMYILLTVSKLQCHRSKQDRLANRLFNKGWGTIIISLICCWGKILQLCETYIHSL